MVIDIVRREHLSAALLNGMHQLRAQIFKDKKQWDVVVSDRWEVDAFDDLNPYYLLISNPSAGEVIGCWRILESVGPYMLKDTFPELLHGAPAPQDSRTLELSRFVVRAQHPGNSTFSQITLQAIREVVRFALRRNAQRLLTVTTVGVERMMRRTGISMVPFGPALRIGVEQAIALTIHLDEKTCQALFGSANMLTSKPDSPSSIAPARLHATPIGMTDCAQAASKQQNALPAAELTV
ncbi:GNAT family N-acetyltransferase [Pseudomonas corrugata]|jgi:acyl homoserine lactone synthase|uniref:acyl-homoserine-lactone synthase n=1 Tax=Pseudomonas corrugata TaxID=47879 RepID=UPI0018E5B098|nr:acyl-homoserine-lactone synthase [Pseudomonas corrugata]MBI6621970.1 GNAT family N-acetyltransferase [Pseudomonas corrugata]MBI6692417.1 GNAT family N-acetyltransferase [Pseudomonas corrugata]